MALDEQNTATETSEHPQSETVGKQNSETEILEHPQPRTVRPKSRRTENPNDHKPLSKLLSKIILFVAGSQLLIWAGYLLINQVKSATTAKAFVNGEVITINSPTQGQVRERRPLSSGMQVADQEVLLNIVDTTANIEQFNKNQFDLAIDKAKLELIEDRIQGTSSSNHSNYREQLVGQISASSSEGNWEENASQDQVDLPVFRARQNLIQAEIELKTAQSNVRLDQAKYAKVYHLAKEGAMPTFSANEMYNKVQASQDQVEIAKLRVETARQELAQQRRLSNFQGLSIASILPIASSTNPMLSDLERQRGDLQINVMLRQKALNQLIEDSKRIKGFQAVAPIKGVVLETSVQNGDHINAGQPLLKILNCQNLWIDAYIDGNNLQRVQIGNTAEIEIPNRNLKLTGKVKTIRFAPLEIPKLGKDAAIDLTAINSDKQFAQLRIEFDKQPQLAADKDNPNEFCYVGQVAQVTIQPKSSLPSGLLRFMPFLN